MSVDLGEGVCEQIQHGTAGKAAVLECKAEAEEGKEEVRTEADLPPLVEKRDRSPAAVLAREGGGGGGLCCVIGVGGGDW